MAKSIIDVDVRDAAFAKFQAAFAKYQAALKAMPADWVKVGAASTEASKKFTAATDELEKQQEAFERIAKAEALRKPWMQEPYDAANLRAQIKDFEACAKAARKILAIIAPPKPKDPVTDIDGKPVK